MEGRDAAVERATMQSRDTMNGITSNDVKCRKCVYTNRHFARADSLSRRCIFVVSKIRPRKRIRRYVRLGRTVFGRL